MTELLVAQLVLGVGVLGIAGLLVLGLQQNRAALLHGEAVQLAYDMLDRMRANPTAAYDGLDFGDGPPSALDCSRRDCSALEMARFDQAVWRCSLRAAPEAAICEAFRAAGVIASRDERSGLPGGEGAIRSDDGRVTIRLRWQEPNAPQPTVITVESRI